MTPASSIHMTRHGFGTQSSLAWAGYGVEGPAFTSVDGSWTQPASTCPSKKAQQAAFWVGIDGLLASDTSVEQIGTDSDCTKATKKISAHSNYYAWYEMYPQPAVFLSTATYPVAPGDAITAGVSVSGSTFTLRLNDGVKWHFSTVQTGSPLPLRSSAEWIAEAPSSCRGSSCKILPLADFGSLGFTGASANGLPVSSSGFTVDQINMTTRGSKIVKARTSALTSGGSAFTISWFHI